MKYHNKKYIEYENQYLFGGSEKKENDNNEKDDYQKWLDEIEEDDSDLLREWYELDDKDRYEWLKNHPDPF